MIFFSSLIVHRPTNLGSVCNIPETVKYLQIAAGGLLASWKVRDDQFTFDIVERVIECAIRIRDLSHDSQVPRGKGARETSVCDVGPTRNRPSESNERLDHKKSFQATATKYNHLELQEQISKFIKVN